MMSDLTHPAVRHFSAAAETVEEYPGASFCHTGVDTADVPKVMSPASFGESHWVLSPRAINLEGKVCSAAAPSLLAHTGRPRLVLWLLPSRYFLEIRLNIQRTASY